MSPAAGAFHDFIHDPRFPCVAAKSALAFNPHAQFRRLTEDGLYERLRTVVRDRDIAIQGHVNPMLAEHGDASEAAHDSGREVFAGWDCPFRTRAVTPA